jgi:transcriptional regulator with XRE-family HTH domain
MPLSRRRGDRDDETDPATPKTLLAAKLSRRLRELHLRPKDLEERAGIGKSSVSRYLSGQSAPEDFDRLALLAKALDVSADYLIDPDQPAVDDPPTFGGVVGVRLTQHQQLVLLTVGEREIPALIEALKSAPPSPPHAVGHRPARDGSGGQNRAKGT